MLNKKFASGCSLFRWLPRAILSVGLVVGASVAVAAPGDFPLGSWTDTAVSSGTPLSFPTVQSEGAPSIGLSATQTSAQTGLGPAESHSLQGLDSNQITSVSNLDFLLGGPVSQNHVVTHLQYTPAVASFGPDATQGDMLNTPSNTGLTLYYSPIAENRITGSTLTIQREGGATFGAVGASLWMGYAVTAGGVGSTFVTLTRSLGSSSDDFLVLDGLVIHGPVSGVQVTRDTNFAAGDQSHVTANETLVMLTRVNPAVLPHPTAAAVPTLSLPGLGLLLAGVLGAAGWARRRGARG